MPAPTDRDHLLSSVSRPRPAKVHTASHEKAESVRLLGACVDEVRRVAGLTLDEFSVAIDRDSRQVSKWITGHERPQLETVFAVERFRSLLVIAMARAAGVEIETTIRVRRSA